MKKQYLYPQNMRTEAKLWFWGLKDIIILAIALTVSVVSWAKLNFMIPAAITLIYGFLSMRLDESSVLDPLCRGVPSDPTAILRMEGITGWQIRNSQPPS